MNNAKSHDCDEIIMHKDGVLTEAGASNLFFTSNGNIYTPALTNNILVVVEVKTRSNTYFGQPQEFVTKEKQNHLIAIANYYLETSLLDLEVRFDVIAVIKTQSTYKICHIEDAFHVY